jgi:hypothetical protein
VQWQILKAKIADAKGSKKTPVVDMLDEEEDGEPKELSVDESAAEREMKIEVDVPSGVEDGKEGE